MRILIGGLAAASIALAGGFSSFAQTTTTDTKTKTETKTETKSFQSKDGTQKKTETTTKTKTDQRTITKTVGPKHEGNVRNDDRRPPDRNVRRSNRALGEWTAVVGGKPCIINIFGGFEAGGGGAVSQGCPGDLADIGNWQLQGCTTLVFTKLLIVPVATLRRIDAYRFDGTTASGQRITLYR